MDFKQWVNHYDGNEAGMTLRDILDPETLHWMEKAWNAAKAEEQEKRYKILPALLRRKEEAND